MADDKTYYLVPIISDEKDHIRQANTKETRKQAITEIFKTKRPKPSQTEFFLLLIRETIFSKEFLFGFVLQFRSSTDQMKQQGTSFASFAFQNDGSEMFLAFRDKIKKNKKFRIPYEESRRILISGLKQRYDNIHSKIRQALNMAYSVRSSPIQIQENKRIVESYIHDLKKPIDTKHLDLVSEIDKARKQLLETYVSKPSLSLTKISKKNRPLIQEIRKEHQEQLLKKYGKSLEKIPQQIDPYYRQKIMKFRVAEQKKRQQQQRQKMQEQDILNKMKPFKQKIQQSIRLYGQTPEMLVEDVVWKQLGLLDPITHQRITNPVILPSSKTIVEKETIQTINEDPISREPLPQNKNKLPINQLISKTIQSVGQQADTIMNSTLPLNAKVFKLIQLRERNRNPIDKQRLK